ncbi:MAG: hypothetical protein RBT20_15160 [Syntrophales bacterium]|jgi:hypothetical protein|nr:hypothetical protein [Syntrophales bacterium]
MEQTNLFKGIDPVIIHAIEHDIVLAQGTISTSVATGIVIGI